MLGGEDEAEAAITLIGEPFVGLLGHMCRMIVEDDLDSCVGRNRRRRALHETDQFARSMAFFDAGVHFPRHKVDAGEQAQRSAPAMPASVNRRVPMAETPPWRGVKPSLDALIDVAAAGSVIKAGASQRPMRIVRLASLIAPADATGEQSPPGYS